MTLRKPFNIKKFDEKVINQLNQNEERLYQVKLEARHHTDKENGVVTTKAYPFQDIETGHFFVSANGSPHIDITIPFYESKTKIMAINTHAIHTSIEAHTIDVTNSEITIRTIIDSATNVGLSKVTTACVTVYWSVISSHEKGTIP